MVIFIAWICFIKVMYWKFCITQLYRQRATRFRSLDIVKKYICEYQGNGLGPHTSRLFLAE